MKMEPGCRGSTCIAGTKTSTSLLIVDYQGNTKSKPSDLNHLVQTLPLAFLDAFVNTRRPDILQSGDTPKSRK